MASKFWVGGTGTWDQSSTTHWSSTSGGATGAAVPTASDDVFFDANSGTGTCTISANAPCNSINSTNSTLHTLALSASVTVTIGSATAGASSVALDFSGFTALTIASTDAFSFISTSTTQQNVNFNNLGLSSANVTFNGVAGSWKLTGTVNTAGTITLTNGTLNTNGQTISAAILNAANTNTRTLTLGASAITLTGTAFPWTLNTVTNLTFNANTSTITLTGASGGFAGGGLTYNNVSLTGSGNQLINQANTFANLTRTGTAVQTDELILNASQTITGTLTLTGNSLTNRLLVLSGTLGTPFTLTAAAVSLTNVDFMDTTGAGAASPFTGSSLGDCQGNSGITFPASQTRYAVAAGNWTSTSIWSSTSGGASGSSVPLPQDNVFLDANTGTGAVNMNLLRAGNNIDMTAFTGTLQDSTVASWIFGNFAFGSGLTRTHSQPWIFAGRGSQTLTMNGITFGGNVTFQGYGGTYTLQDAVAFSGSTNGITHTAGTINTNGKSVTTAFITSNSGTTRTLTLGASTLTLGTAGNPWNVTTSGLTFNANTSTLNFTNISVSAQTITLAGLTYNNITFSGAGGSNTATVTGGGTINGLWQITCAPCTVAITSSTTITLGNFHAMGSSGNLITINAVTSGTACTFSKSGGTVQCDFLSLKDIHASGGATFYAGANSTNTSNNIGWTFTALPGAAQSLSQASSAVLVRTVLRAQPISQSQTASRGVTNTQATRATTQAQSPVYHALVPKGFLTSTGTAISKQSATNKVFAISQASSISMAGGHNSPTTVSATQSQSAVVNRNYKSATPLTMSQSAGILRLANALKPLALTEVSAIVSSSSTRFSRILATSGQSTSITTLPQKGHTQVTSVGATGSVSIVRKLVRAILQDTSLTSVDAPITSRALSVGSQTLPTVSSRGANLRTFSFNEIVSPTALASNRGYAVAVSTTQSSTLINAHSASIAPQATQGTAPALTRNVPKRMTLTQSATVTKRSVVVIKGRSSTVATAAAIQRGAQATKSVSQVTTPSRTTRTLATRSPTVTIAPAVARAWSHTLTYAQAVSITQKRPIPGHTLTAPPVVLLPARRAQTAHNFTISQAQSASAKRFNTHGFSASQTTSAILRKSRGQIIATRQSQVVSRKSTGNFTRSVAAPTSPTLLKPLRGRTPFVASQPTVITRARQIAPVTSVQQATTASFKYHYNWPVMGQVWLPSPTDVLNQEYGDVYVIASLPDFQFILNGDDVPTLNVGPRVRMVPLDPTRVK